MLCWSEGTNPNEWIQITDHWEEPSQRNVLCVLIRHKMLDSVSLSGNWGTISLQSSRKRGPQKCLCGQFCCSNPKRNVQKKLTLKYVRGPYRPPKSVLASELLLSKCNNNRHETARVSKSNTRVQVPGIPGDDIIMQLSIQYSITELSWHCFISFYVGWRYSSCLVVSVICPLYWLEDEHPNYWMTGLAVFFISCSLRIFNLWKAIKSRAVAKLYRINRWWIIAFTWQVIGLVSHVTQIEIHNNSAQCVCLKFCTSCSSV